MSNTVSKTYHIKSTTAKVWEALTTPEIIKKYFFDTNVKGEWKKGSTITFSGEYQGKEYEDKGIILDIVPGKLLTINFWSSMTGKPDTSENYSPYSYKLSEHNGHTDVTIEQSGKFETDESKEKAFQHWDIVMDGLKKLLEGAD